MKKNYEIFYKIIKKLCKHMNYVKLRKDIKFEAMKNYVKL